MLSPRDTVSVMNTAREIAPPPLLWGMVGHSFPYIFFPGRIPLQCPSEPNFFTPGVPPIPCQLPLFYSSSLPLMVSPPPGRFHLVVSTTYISLHTPSPQNSVFMSKFFLITFSFPCVFLPQRLPGYRDHPPPALYRRPSDPL